MNLIDRLAERDMLELVDAVCRKHHVTRAEVCGKLRTPHVCRARFEIWLRLAEDHGWSSVTIGVLWDRDHSTVLSGIKRALAERTVAV